MEKVRSFEVVLPLLALGGVALWINYYYRKRPTISGGQQEAAEVDDAKEDYFSQLPDDVLFSILANLTVSEAARTTILSKKWKYIFYLGVERLDLSFSRFVSYPISYPIKDFSKFFKFSVKTLSQASSLKQLILSNCIVLSSPNIRFNSLTTLVLNGVLLASGHLEGILSSCSNLKQLIIENCRLPYKLRLTSTVTSIVIWDCDGVKEIDLHAADLHTLEFTMNSYNNVRFLFSFVPMLENVILFPRGLASLPYIFGDFARNLPAQVKSLTVKCFSRKSNYFPTETKMFRNLRTLSLILMIMDDSFEFEMVKLSPILGACPRLQYLSFVVSRARGVIDERGSRRAPLSRTCHTELKQVTFNGFAGTESEMEFVRYIMRSAIVLEQMFLSPRYKYSRFVPREDSIASLDQRKRNSIKQKLHEQAISRKAVVIIQ